MTSGTRACSGRRHVTPLFGVPVPVLAHRLADPAKGTGIAMVCTFGDADRRDVVAGPAAGDPPGDRPGRPAAGPSRRPGISSRGRAGPPTPSSRARPPARPGAGSPSCSGRRARCAASRSRSAHAVKFYEKGDLPLEIITTRQWYIRNGSRDAAAAGGAAGPRPRAGLAPGAHAVPVRELGGRADRRLAGQPAAVRWACRCRCGTRLDAAGTPDREHPIVPADADLPVDPAADVPAGYRAGPAERARRVRRPTRTCWTPGPPRR